ncbi:MAG: AMP-dependent synthetase and [Rhodospirillaceae bacterium]|nr:MAG: AMP-dependent synthetase and [Rhodospirillaceae bacterium]TNC98798.1 MAG: AMP-dependent synthetase and ligase [Stygiobacter sp.]
MPVDLATCPSIPAMVLDQADSLGDRPLLGAKRDGAWHYLSWRQTVDAALSLAGGLVRLGLEPGDRVMLVSENRPEWAIADLAIMIAGGITVPAYVTNTADDHRHILENVQARLVVVSTLALVERVMAVAARASQPPTLICLEPPRLAQAPGFAVLEWQQVLDMGAGEHAAMRDRAARLCRDDTACIIHTSGTGGAPRGVMLSHGALLADCLGAHALLRELGLDDQVFLSFLPLSHSYEHTVGLIFPLGIGATIAYAEGLDQLAANMGEVRPTIMTAVPRLYVSMRARILGALRRQGGIKEKLFLAALHLGTKRLIGQKLSWGERLADLALDRLVRAKVRQRFGGRLKALVSGGAPLAFEVGAFFAALGVRILQGYGQTEAGPAISCSPPGKIKLDTVGPPLHGISVRIADDGEILVKGEVLMQGYWRDAEATARAIGTDGWLHTGDIGEMDEDGYIRITDRKKDIIVNSGGDNISPQRIEGLLTLQPEIAQAMVHGDKRPHLVALIVAAEECDATQAAKAVERVNSGLSTIEKIRRHTVIDQAFTTDNLMLTPTMKIRRHIIRQHFAEQIERLYGDRAD